MYQFLKKFSTFFFFFFVYTLVQQKWNTVYFCTTSFVLAEITFKKINQQISFKNSLLADEILYENSFKNDKKISNHQKIRGKIKFKITTWYVILLILFLGIQEKTKILNKYQIKYINSKYKLNYDAFFIKTIVSIFTLNTWIIVQMNVQVYCYVFWQEDCIKLHITYLKMLKIMYIFE